MKAGFLTGVFLATSLVFPCALAEAQQQEPLCSSRIAFDRWNNCFGQIRDGSQMLYSGRFERGVFSGLGTLVTPEGAYSGEFRNGQFDGHGILILPDGFRYIGDFRAGMMHGTGRIVNTDGSSIDATFNDGEPVDNEAGPTAPAEPQVPAPPPAPPAQNERVAATQPATPEPQTQPVRQAKSGYTGRPRDGIYLRTQFFGSQLSTSTYQVLGNRIAENPQKVMRADEFSSDFASKIGTYRIEGNRMIIMWEGSDREASNTFKADSDCPNFAGGITCRVATFRDGETIAGTFSGTIATASLSSSIRLRLNRDGTYSMTSQGMVNAPDTGAVSQGVETGRYRIASSSSIIFVPDAGPQRETLIFPYPADNPDSIWLGNRHMPGQFDN